MHALLITARSAIVIAASALIALPACSSKDHRQVATQTGHTAGASAGSPSVAAGQVQATPAPGLLSVDGVATLQVVPDVVDVSMTLSVEEPRPRAALKRLQDKREEMMSALLQSGLEKTQLTLSTIDLHPTYFPHPRHQKIKGYEASLTIVAELRDFDAIGAVMENAAGASVERISTHFRSTRLPELKKQVRELALRAARDKAQQMAQLMDVTLGRVVKMSEGQDNGWRSASLSNMNEFVPASRQNQLGPGGQPITLTVQVSYEI